MPGFLFGGTAASGDFSGLSGLPTTIIPFLGTSSARGISKEVHISARTDGMGIGTAEDPFDGHTQANFQNQLDALTDGVVNVAPGAYAGYALTVSKSVVIQGPRTAVFTQATGDNKPIFAVSGSTTQFTLDGPTLEHGAVFREEANFAAIHVTGATDQVRLLGIYSSDFHNTVRVDATLNELIVLGSEFVYTHGRASISNASPYTDPVAAICGNPIKRLVVQDCIFNGLLDPTFTGVTGSPPTLERVAADNFVQTGNHDFATVDNNQVLNHGIEGIYLSRSVTAGDYTYRISNNHMTPAIGQAGAYSPGVSLLRSRCTVTGNKFSGHASAVNVLFTDYDEEENVVNIDNNNFDRVLVGVNASGVSSKSTFHVNTIFHSSEPARTIYGELADNTQGCRPTEFLGIVTDRGYASHNILVAPEPVWNATVTLVSRGDTNLFYFSVDDAAQLAVDGVLISYFGGTVSYFPIESIFETEITVSSDWAIAYPGVTSGTLYYAKSSASFSSAAGIVVRTGGNVVADGNVIVGYQNDLGQQNSGTITVSNHTTHACHHVQPDNGTFIHADVTHDDVNKRFDLTALQNTWSSTGYKVWDFVTTNEGANIKRMRLVFNQGHFQIIALNDNLTEKFTWLDLQPDGIVQVDKIYTNSIKLNTGQYINLSPTEGSTGYGFRDNAGVVEVKNSGGDWSGVNASVTRTTLTETATLTLPVGSDSESTASGTLTTIAFSGTPSYTQGPIILRLLVSGGPRTITIPSSYRLGETTPVTSLTFQNGWQEANWIWSNSKYLLIDTGDDGTITITGTPSSGQVPIASSGTAAAWGDVSGSVSDTAYDASSWDAVTTIAPSKNAVRDKFQTFSNVDNTADINKNVNAALIITGPNEGLSLIAGLDDGGGDHDKIAFDNFTAVTFGTGKAALFRTGLGLGTMATHASTDYAASAYLVKTTTYTAVSGDKILCDTSGGSFTVTLPASPSNGDNVTFIDAQGSFTTHALTVGRNSQSIAGAASDLTASTNNQAFQLVFAGGSMGWQVVRYQ